MLELLQQQVTMLSKRTGLTGKCFDSRITQVCLLTSEIIHTDAVLSSLEQFKCSILYIYTVVPLKLGSCHVNFFYGVFFFCGSFKFLPVDYNRSFLLNLQYSVSPFLSFVYYAAVLFKSLPVFVLFSSIDFHLSVFLQNVTIQNYLLRHFILHLSIVVILCCTLQTSSILSCFLLLLGNQLPYIS